MRLPVTLPIQRSHPLARLLSRGDVVALTLRADGRLDLERTDGSRAEAEVLADTAVFVRLVALRLRSGERVESLILTPAATGADAHRRLRVWLGARAKLSGAA